MVLALTLSVGGYVGEVVRGALLSVPRGEMEAARAYGFRGFGCCAGSGCRGPCRR